MLVGATTRRRWFSFIDGFTGYNQIKMDHCDPENSVFHVPIGNFHYTAMSFGLKNAVPPTNAR